ncbi:hypothetical protein RJT34_20480 [Clitoria ternatea]|uniref:Fungal lipase-type domain-containing protein n=1 Tax=Clitoria ternatea TaxID=43366 RepID=A0AAN9ISW3_CLITE
MARGRYLIVFPENGGVTDLIRYAARRGGDNDSHRFLEGTEPSHPDHRWIILISMILRKIIAFFAKPLYFLGSLLDFLLNLLSHNGTIFGLLHNFLHGKVVIPEKGSKSFISTIGELDNRVHLCGLTFKPELGNRPLMDLCVMASKCTLWTSTTAGMKRMSTQVFILCDKPKGASLILVSFRGTEPFDADDWSTDLDYSWFEIPGVGKLHMGFVEALGLGNRVDPATFYSHLQTRTAGTDSSDGDQSLTSAEGIRKMTAYYTVRSKLESLLEEHKNAKFIVTGHSLGGALAILFPTMLVVHEEMGIMERLLGVYTFGQPRIGDRQLGRFMEAHLHRPVPKYFRVVYCNDLVPRLPYDDKTFLYKHFGVCLYYNSFYTEKEVEEEPNRNSFGPRFILSKHVNAIWELIKGLLIGYVEGPEYKEGWFRILFRVIGVVLPGISAHCPTDYVNSIRLGKESSIRMPSI